MDARSQARAFLASYSSITSNSVTQVCRIFHNRVLPLSPGGQSRLAVTAAIIWGVCWFPLTTT